MKYVPALCLATVLSFTIGPAQAVLRMSVAQMNEAMDLCYEQTLNIQKNVNPKSLSTASCSKVLFNDWLTKEAESNTRLNRGLINLNIGNTEKAIQDFKRVIKITPKSYKAHVVLAQIFEREQELSQAIYYYDQAILISNSDPSVIRNRELVAKALNKENSSRLTMSTKPHNHQN